MSTFVIPDFALVVLISPDAAVRSTFAARHFGAGEVHRPDPAGAATADRGLHDAVARQLRARRLVVVDDDNLRIQDRQPYIELARRHHAAAVAVVLEHEASSEQLRREGFRRIHRLDSAHEVELSRLRRRPLRSDRRLEPGPFDIVGDVHGCADELEELLRRLGYAVRCERSGGVADYRVAPPPGRKAVFLGDLVDRGPRVPDVLRLVMRMVTDGSALCVMGNHDDKLLRWLDGRKVKISHGLDASVLQLEQEAPAFRAQVRTFLAGLADHYWLDQGRLCVAHAGLDEGKIGRISGAVRAFALYGDTSGERDEHGLPVRRDWAARYRGITRVVYGHTPVSEPVWRHNTICLDTGCVFGGSLTALRYPDNELVSVTAREVYFESLRPFAELTAPSLPQ